ncbi:MAG: tRNA pseudouridine(55) synthase TruB [Alphaproteobacteria bacterium]|nr:tRNA pseudouridine(55) synthase TruB [Alphaproteobacteria bacterium]
MNSSGFILLDKPSGISSRAAGGRIARMFGAKTFGHVGTLDPMASGLLVIALGEATKVIPYLDETATKEYEFSIQWGIRTDTDDITGKILEQNENIPTEKQIHTVCESLIGEIWQTPPSYSAVHVGGRRAYQLARAGKSFEIPARKITIYDLKFINNSKFIVRCSPGTYIRSLARDIAAKCETIAACDSIRRTHTNGFDIKNAVRLDFLENLFNNSGRAGINNYLQPPDFGLGDIPVWNLNETDAKLFQNGGFIRDAKRETRNAKLLRVYHNDKFIGIGFIEDCILKPNRVINI